jgi:peptide/bleomycin uptake transporter
LFALFWRLYAPHPWARWSIWGSALILFVTYLQVQLSVAVNAWYGPFYDLVQVALDHSGAVSPFGRVLPAARDLLEHRHGRGADGRADRFFVSHYVFRWRTAMNDYYMVHWPTLRRSKARPSASRKTRCASPPPWRRSASA